MTETYVCVRMAWRCDLKDLAADGCSYLKRRAIFGRDFRASCGRRTGFMYVCVYVCMYRSYLRRRAIFGREFRASGERRTGFMYVCVCMYV